MVLKSSVPDVPIEKLNLSFSGCGFLGIYHMGVACCFREYLPQICDGPISGASIGSLVATALACKLNLGKCACHILEVAIKARNRSLGPFHPSFNINEIILNALIDVLPPNAHELVNGKIHISVTRVSDGQNCILSHFETRADLIQAILCSCFIPFWSGYIPPKFQGVAYMDGGFSKNILILDKNTITVSPFSGESDICPLDSTYNAYKINYSNTSISLSPENLYRITRILFPAKPEIMGKMCQQGFYDALRYLQRNNRIACTRCIAVQSTFVINDDESNCDENSTDDEQNDNIEDESYLFKNKKSLNVLKENLDCLNENLADLQSQADINSSHDLTDDEIDKELRKLVEFNNRINKNRNNETLNEEFIHAIEQDFQNGTHKDHCKNCLNRKENIFNENLPDNINQAIQEACDKVNKGLINYIFKFKIVKILSTLTEPYILPFDITIALLKRLRGIIPLVSIEIKSSLKKVMQFIMNLVNGVKNKHITTDQQQLANFNCKVALTEFDYTDRHNNLTKDNIRKISNCSSCSIDICVENEKPKMQKSNSFKLSRQNSIEAIRYKLKKICSSENLTAKATNQSVVENKKQKRKSYAGGEFNNIKNIAPERRISVLDFLGCKAPERVLSKMNLNFSIDLNEVVTNDQSIENKNFHFNSNDMTDSFFSPTSGSTRPGTPIKLANNVLNLGINDIEQQEQNLEMFNSKLKGLTNKEALMAFHFTGDDNVVEVTEIFNITDEENNNSLEEKSNKDLASTRRQNQTFI